MNISPSIWGESSWKFLHCITLGYPENPDEETKQAALNFFPSLGYLLPCIKCRNNFKKHMDVHPLNMEIVSDKSKLINWLLDVHNEVNSEINKPKLYLSDIEKICSHNNNRQFNTKVAFILILIVLLIIIIITIHYGII